MLQTCLNPYSNGILSDNLKESALDFSCFSPGALTRFPSESWFHQRNFSQMYQNSTLIPNKMRVYLLNLLNASGLCFRKSFFNIWASVRRCKNKNTQWYSLLLRRDYHCVFVWFVYWFSFKCNSFRPALWSADQVWQLPLWMYSMAIWIFVY